MPTVTIKGWRLDTIRISSDDGNPDLNLELPITYPEQSTFSLEFNDGTIIEVLIDDEPTHDTILVKFNQDQLGLSTTYERTHEATTGWETRGGSGVFIDDPYVPHYCDEVVLVGGALESVQIV